MLDELKIKTGKDQDFLEGIAGKCKGIRNSKAGFAAGILLLPLSQLLLAYFLCSIIFFAALLSLA